MDNEVKIVNGSVVGVHLGAPMQDATPDKVEDNEQYATERNTVTRTGNSKELLDDQPNKGTHYDTRDIRTVTYTFDGNLEGKEVVTVGAAPVVRITDNVVEPSSVRKVSLDLYMIADGRTQSDSSMAITEIDRGIYMASQGALIVTDDNESGLSQGIYAVYMEGQGYVSRITIEYVASGELKKLDEKFIPPTTMRVMIVSEDDEGNPVTNYSSTDIYNAFMNGRTVFFQEDEDATFMYMSLCNDVEAEFYAAHITNGGVSAQAAVVKGNVVTFINFDPA